jgi:hypothetical protein
MGKAVVIGDFHLGAEAAWEIFGEQAVHMNSLSDGGLMITSSQFIERTGADAVDERKSRKFRG